MLHMLTKPPIFYKKKTTIIWNMRQIHYILERIIRVYILSPIGIKEEHSKGFFISSFSESWNGSNLLSLLPKQSGTKSPQYVLWYFDDGILGFWFLGTPWVDWGLLPVLSSRVTLVMLVAPGGVRDWTWGSYMQNMHTAHKLYSPSANEAKHSILKHWLQLSHLFP